MPPMPDLLATVHRRRQAIFAFAMIVLVLAILWIGRAALPAFLIGLALAFVLDPAVTLLARRGVPRWAGILIMYVAGIAVIWVIVAVALPPITEQAREFVDHPPDIRETIDAQIAASGQIISDLIAALLAPTVNAIVRAATFLLGLVVVPVW